MPDFERVIDSLEVHLATTPEQRRERLAYIRGKNVARMQIAIAFALIAALAIVVQIMK